MSQGRHKSYPLGNFCATVSKMKSAFPGGALGRLGNLASSQRGYFTTSQAVSCGIPRSALTKAVRSGRVTRLDHGVYRAAHAGHDPLEWLRVPYMRLEPNADPASRMSCPEVWVAGCAATRIYGYGALAASVAEFCAKSRIRPRPDRSQRDGSVPVVVRHVPEGVPDGEWEYRGGFAVLSVERVAADLVRDGQDWDHVGRFMRDAVRAGSTNAARLIARVRLPEDTMRDLLVSQ